MIQPVSSSPSPSAAPVNPELRKAAIAFEAVMLRQLIGEMRKGALADDIFGSSANSTYRELADARTADALAQRGAIGIAAMIERQLASLPLPSGEGQGVGSLDLAPKLIHPTPTPPLKGRSFRSAL